MIRLFHVYFPSRLLFLALSEALLIVGALLTAFSLWSRLALGSPDDLKLLQVAVASVVLMLCMYYYDLYDPSVLYRWIEILARIVQVLGTASVILAGLYYAFPETHLSRGLFIIWIALAGLSLIGWRRLFVLLNKSRRLSERTVFLGAGPMALELSSSIESRPELGLALVGYVGVGGSGDGGVNGLTYLGDVDGLPALVERERINRVVLTMEDRRGLLPVEMLLNLKGQGLLVQDAPDVYEAINGRLNLDSLRPSRLLFSDGFRPSRFNLAYKRVVSIALAAVGIVLTAPLMALIALAIRLDSRGPVMFRQKRVGKGGRIFTIFKFRSMRADADGDGEPQPAVENDSRVTRVGRWLRRLRLDELLQMFNILRGDMYFIGPRPFTPNMEAELSRQIPFYSQRWQVKPGATGWAQIRRGYCGTLEDNVEKLGYDLFYIKNLSVGLDLLIVFETVKIVLLGRGGR